MVSLLRPAAVAALSLGLLTACPGEPAPRFHAVVAESRARLAAELGPEPTPPATDDEVVVRVRARIAALAHDDSPLRPLGLAGAKEWGDAIVPVLNQTIGSPTTPTAERTTAIEMLAVLDTPRGAAALASHVESHPASWVRATCAHQLGETTQDHVIVRLLAALAREKDVEVRRWIGSTLARFGCHAHVVDRARAERWRLGDPELERTAPAPSARLRLETWTRVAALATDDESTHAATIDVLGDLPTFAVDVLVAALLDEDVRVRRGVARALERMGPRAIGGSGALLRAFDADPSIDVECALALGSLRVPGVRTRLEARLADPGPSARPLELRAACARALGSAADPAATSALRAALAETGSGPLHRAAALALVELGDLDAGLAPLCALGATSDDLEIDAALCATLRRRAGEVQAELAREIEETLEAPSPRERALRTAAARERWFAR